MKYLITNNTHTPQLRRSVRTQTLTLDGVRIEPARTSRVAELGSDVLSAMREGLVRVERLDGVQVTVITEDTLRKEGLEIRETKTPKTTYSADGAVTRLVPCLQLVAVDEEDAEPVSAETEEVEEEAEVPAEEPEVEEEAPLEEEVEAPETEEEVEEEVEEEAPATSSDLKGAEAISVIEKIEAVEDLDAFVDGETRKTVKAAAASRREALSE
jgi:hypothetical protein